MSKEIRALTGLRGVAAGYVCIYHLLFGRDSTGFVIQRALSKGYLAVDVFFILSGLVMALTYRTMFENRYRVIDHADFLLRRAARIMPLYIVILAASVIVSWIGGSPASAETVLANLFLIQSWGLNIPGIINPAWSISTEVAAYILFPALLAMAVSSSRAAAWVSLVGAAACVVLATIWVTPAARVLMKGPLDVWDEATCGPLLRCLGGFLLGLLTYRVASSPRVSAIARSDVLGLTVLLLLGAGIAWDVHDFVLYPLFPILVLCLTVNRARLASIAGCWPLHWLGVLSYGIYLIHSLVIDLLWPASQTWLDGRSTIVRGVVSATLCISVTLVLALILHLAVERPGRSWVRRITWKPRAQPVTSV